MIETIADKQQKTQHQALQEQVLYRETHCLQAIYNSLKNHLRLHDILNRYLSRQTLLSSAYLSGKKSLRQPAELSAAGDESRQWFVPRQMVNITPSAPDEQTASPADLFSSPGQSTGWKNFPLPEIYPEASRKSAGYPTQRQQAINGALLPGTIRSASHYGSAIQPGMRQEPHAAGSRSETLTPAVFLPLTGNQLAGTRTTRTRQRMGDPTTGGPLQKNSIPASIRYPVAQLPIADTALLKLLPPFSGYPPGLPQPGSGGIRIVAQQKGLLYRDMTKINRFFVNWIENRLRVSKTFPAYPPAGPLMADKVSKDRTPAPGMRKTVSTVSGPGTQILPGAAAPQPLQPAGTETSRQGHLLLPELLFPAELFGRFAVGQHAGQQDIYRWVRHLAGLLEEKQKPGSRPAEYPADPTWPLTAEFAKIKKAVQNIEQNRLPDKRELSRLLADRLQEEARRFGIKL